MDIDYVHISVLLKQAVDGLKIEPGGIYVDCTLGGGGHSSLILERLQGTGRVIGLDQDQKAIDHAKMRFAGVDNMTIERGNFEHLKEILSGLGIGNVDGFIFDLGVSSPQLDEEARGFSYRYDAPLDMRMDQGQLLSAKDVLNGYAEERLADIIFQYGEERWAQRIAEFIVGERQIKPLETTHDLVRVIEKAIPKKVRQGKKHAATKTFQAIRIEVNNEFGVLEEGLNQALDCLKDKGRLSVITFHSLEDRMVKTFFKGEAAGCTCPPDFPICVCNKQPRIKIINRKPIEAEAEEVKKNRRSRSAKLRIAEKVKGDES